MSALSSCGKGHTYDTGEHDKCPKCHTASGLPLSAEQIEHWRRICLSHWATDCTKPPNADGSRDFLEHAESVRQANALCDQARLTITLREERDAAVTFIRVVGEEVQRNGYPCGDRETVLANVRRVVKELDAALAQSADAKGGSNGT